MDEKVEENIKADDKSHMNAHSPSPCQKRTPSSHKKSLSVRSPDAKVRYSFEDELTFSPRLNSLSMKIVSEVNRPSIIKRKQEKKAGDTINFAFKPNLSNNSTKIVAKMNTCFWDRQNKIVQRRLEMVEQGPSTIHPNLRYTTSKENSEENKKKDAILTSLSEQICTINAAFNNKKKRCKSKSPYEKSVDILVKLKKEDVAFHFKKLKRKCNNHIEKNGSENCAKCNCNDKVTKNTCINRRKLNENTIQTKTNKNYITNNLKTDGELQTGNEQKNDKVSDINLEKNIQAIASATKILLETQSSINDTPSKNKIKHLELRKQRMLEKKKSIENVLLNNNNNNNQTNDGDKIVERNGKVVRKHGRNFTFPATTKERTDEMDAIHQNLMKIKKVAGQAIKKKKVFVCNGPYSSLRVALRKRGWIEKHFKGGDPSLVTQMLVSNSYEEDETCTSESKLNQTLETTCDFLCDNQYGIMSRIVRKTMPILLWTLRRDDIDFRYLHKEQIVNHFLSAWSFTTKAGLCLTLQNLRYFDDTNALLFFPRCYRLCCDEEKEEFIEDYQITALQCILKIVIAKHESWEKYILGDSDDKIEEPPQTDACEESTKKTQKKELLNSDILRLVFKNSYEYLESKQHVDIEGGYPIIDDVQKKVNWTKIIDYFTKLALEDCIITDARDHVDECKRILRKMEAYHPQLKIDGHQNIWILKPGAKSRGRGIEIMNVLSEILNLSSSDTVSKRENKWVIQKYIEKPFLIYRTKFDIRQWFLVTDWNPLMLWFYKDCYTRFCGQEFQLDNFDPQVHLSNNSVQKHFKNGIRSVLLPESNMWSNEKFTEFLQSRGQENYWDDVIYPGMKKAITAVLISSQDSLEYRKNSFELYGADFMLGEDLQPWLIEINASPALGPSTPVTERLCRNVLEDTLKVVLDRRENKECDTGKFELAYKRPFIAMPSYIGCNIAVEGMALKPLSVLKKKNNVNVKSPSPVKISENSLPGDPIACEDSSKIVTPKKNDPNIVGSKNVAGSPNNLPVVKYSTKEVKTSKCKSTEFKHTKLKTCKPLIIGNVKRSKAAKIKKSKSHHDSEIIRALIEPRICTFPLDTESQAEAFRNLRNTHPCYRFSSPDEMKNGDINDDSETDNVDDLELFQPFKMRYRNIKNLHNTSLSRQFSLMTAEDVLRLKKRRWNAVTT